MSSLDSVASLLARAASHGFRLAVASDRTLHIEGPRKHDDIAQQILSRKAEVLAHLDPQPELAELPEPGPMLTCLGDVEAQEVSWLWPGRIPLGRITLLVGRPGEGKSFLTAYLASRVSRGRQWPDGAECEAGSVLLMTAEDDPGDTIRPRLDAHNADCRRVHLLSAVRRVDEQGHYERLVTLADIDAIEQALTRLGDCRLLVVDPVGSFLGPRADAHRDNEVRAVLAPLATLAEQHDCAVLVVAHTRKALSVYADDMVLGSRAFTGIARAVWHLSRDPQDRTRRLLLPGKANLADEPSGLAFRIEGRPAALAWEADPVAMRADDALAAEAAARRPGPEAEAQREAEEFLRQALANGPRLAREVEAEAYEGYSISKRTLRRARQAIGAEAYREVIPGPWFWRQGGQDANQEKELGHLGHLEKTLGKLPVAEGDAPKVAKFHDLGHLGPEDSAELSDERAAIAEFDGGLAREEAERLARDEWGDVI